MNAKITAQYWLDIAVRIAQASTCRADVGCVLVYKNEIVGHGYVGSVHGDMHCNACTKNCEEWNHILVKTDRKGSTKSGDTCIRTIHAEMNAVLKCTVRGSQRDGWIECYSTYEPCLECTKVLMQIGVRHIYYIHPYKDDWRDAYIMGLDNSEFRLKKPCDRLSFIQVSV